MCKNIRMIATDLTVLWHLKGYLLGEHVLFSFNQFFTEFGMAWQHCYPLITVRSSVTGSFMLWQSLLAVWHLCLVTLIVDICGKKWWLYFWWCTRLDWSHIWSDLSLVQQTVKLLKWWQVCMLCSFAGIIQNPTISGNLASVSLCVIVLYVHACCIIVTWWDEPGEIESYLDN